VLREVSSSCSLTLLFGRETCIWVVLKMMEYISLYFFNVYTGQLTRKNFALSSQHRKLSFLILVCQSANKIKSIKKKACEKVFFQQFSTCLPLAYLFLKWSKTGR